ncbi:MAG: phosphoribosylglycinamide formyltransferase [Elusimicrobia bacterium RIFOXYA2_FULL_50_26]|nr:MAG: phosphoribosylglycinamide formyltransferase [Elusimicrobia bacterium RIFOXYA2_FULL_50_26]OGS25273.1 MAG: phosphoribosylglycinamide formyltransferase [Elusimicrobia bacterium RIFOXYB2_FULL_50_12]
MSSNLLQIGVLASGSGSNLQAIIDSCDSGVLRGKARVCVVLSNRRDAFALERARKHSIDAIYIDTASCCCDKLMLSELQKRNTGLVCLAGYMQKISPVIVAAFPERIINIHPALLPLFGGKGMYGHHVHEAVLSANEKESGATVHFVDDEYDHGSIILQRRVPVLAGDTCKTLAARVLEVEHRLYPEAIAAIIGGLK